MRLDIDDDSHHIQSMPTTYFVSIYDNEHRFTDWESAYLFAAEADRKGKRGVRVYSSDYDYAEDTGFHDGLDADQLEELEELGL